MFGLPASVIPSYGELAQLPALLSPRGLKDDAIVAIVGGNYIPVLRQAIQT